MAAEKIELPDDGFNCLQQCRYGVMLFNKNDLVIGESLKLYGEYCEGEVDLFRQFLQPNDLVIDVGANIGAHTVFFAKTVGNLGRVLAFEPQRIVFQTLCANLALNSITNTYTYPVALGKKNDFIQVPQLDPSHKNNFGGLELSDRTQGDPVSVITLDSLNLEVRSGALRLIKIDVEGMELEVLQGAVDTLDRYRPILYVENEHARQVTDSDRQEKSAALVNYLNSIGYKLYWHTPLYYNPNNYLSNGTDVFGKTAAINMFCLHSSLNVEVQGFRPVEIPL